MKRFKERVAIVTGGGSGIGEATAVAFAQHGATVVIADVNVEGGKRTLDTIRAAGGEGLFLETDVSKSSEVQAMVLKTVATYGHLDFAFNNAGTSIGHDFVAEVDEEVWDTILAIDLKGVFLCMKYELQQMIKQKTGAIVNTASAAGLVGVPGSCAYTSSKHGVVGLTKAAALEYARLGIRINAVCPGIVATPLTTSSLADSLEDEAAISWMSPMGRMGHPKEIAGVVLWLCSDEATFVTGTATIADGGFLAQ